MNMIKKKKKIFVFLIIVIVTIIIAFFFIRPKYLLVITDKDNNKRYEFVLPDQKFVLGYIHSVMKTPAEEMFETDKDLDILLVGTVYQSYGVGLPFLPEEGKLVVENGKFILKIHRKFKDINMVISPIAKHYLIIDGQKYMLSSLLGDKPTKIKLTIEKK